MEALCLSLNAKYMSRNNERVNPEENFHERSRVLDLRTVERADETVVTFCRASPIYKNTTTTKRLYPIDSPMYFENAVDLDR